MRLSVRKLAVFAAALITVSACGCTDGLVTDNSSENKAETSAVKDTDMQIGAEDLDISYEKTGSTSVRFDGGSADIDGQGAAADGGVVTVSQAGTYIFSGNTDNGRIIVDAGKDSEVKLVFDGVSVSCADNAPVLVKSADKAFIILEDGSENTVSDGESYSLEEGENTDAAIFSKADLNISGGGSLTVNASFKHGIVSKDDLIVTGGKIAVSSASTALEGKDSVKISGGEFIVSAGTNGIRSTNTEDETKGFISITGGSFDITSGGDGIDAETQLSIEDGEFEITTGGGSANASMRSDGTPNGDWHRDMQGGGMMDPGRRPDGVPGGDMAPAADNRGDLIIENTANTQDTSSGETSSKALKAGKIISISGGVINIDSADDSVHSNGDISVSGGTLTAGSGDDGFHSDGDLTISDGSVEITKSYEGIEGLTVTISGGTLSVTASDDGINCAGGSDTGSEDRMGRDMFTAQDGVFLRITGGELKINSGGDGLDSNGDLYMEGGTVYVSGPENSGNGALDYNGTAEVTGGTIVASGAVGMEECFGESSEQCAVLHDFSSAIAGGTEFTVSDSDGNVILSFTNEKTWQGVVFSSPELKQGKTYTVSAGTQSEQITIDSVITSNSLGGGFGGGFGGNRGGRGF